MNATFREALLEINEIKRRAHFAYVGLSAARALATALIVSSLWFLVEPAKPLYGIALGGLSFLLLMSFTAYKRKHQVHEKDFILSLDMNHQNSTVSPFIAYDLPPAVSDGDWKPRLHREVRRVKAIETRRLTAMSSSITIPALAALLLWFKAPPSLTNVLAEAQDVMSFFDAAKNIEVLSGAIDPKNIGRSISLSGKPPTIELLPQNMLRFTLNTGRRSRDDTPPSIVLTPKNATDASPRPTFQMQGRFDQEGRPAGWTLDFSVDNPSSLSLKSTEGAVLAHLEVQKLPIPDVSLALSAPNEDPWPDNVLLPLNIKVKAHNPLKKIQLSIRSKGKSITEVVTSIYGDTTKDLATDYKLNLEPYMSDDVLEFEIVAEAFDAAQPEPLMGTSQPILVRAASAYGRYKATLTTLSKVRSMIDDATATAKPDLSRDATKLAEQAGTQADASPFFDTLDRVNISKIVNGIQQVPTMDAKAKVGKLIELSSELGSFLFEHETLDDRERDRDFFIAVRTLSRILEKTKQARPVAVEQITQRLKTFLTQRQARWKVRVERMPEAVRPSSWAKIRDQKPFHRGLDESLALDERGQSADSQAFLTKTTNLYKTWIDELEAKEDEFRQKKEREQQQGLANARNELRELQQRQDLISSALDRASTRTSEDLSSKWQSVRPQQNSNSKQAKDLLEQLKAMSPEGGERLSVAISAMEETTGQGNQGDFQTAESASDVAGRLLRDAEQSAARKQQQQSGRGRRKRAAGDDYYGNAMVEGDVEIKTEYQVDARYREDILRDVSGRDASSEDKSLLDNYLRQILR